uniref:Uncharacterized protein n=1 Tax=Oryza brachyantha TaxID=4533 RepID=J3M4Z3_ORYBR
MHRRGLFTKMFSVGNAQCVMIIGFRDDHKCSLLLTEQVRHMTAFSSYGIMENFTAIEKVTQDTKVFNTTKLLISFTILNVQCHSWNMDLWFLMDYV